MYSLDASAAEKAADAFCIFVPNSTSNPFFTSYRTPEVAATKYPRRHVTLIGHLNTVFTSHGPSRDHTPFTLTRVLYYFVLLLRSVAYSSIALLKGLMRCKKGFGE